MQVVLPYAKAGALNTVAGTAVGASMGYPNQVGVNRGGSLQPRTADGRWAPNSSNPGLGAALAANDAFQLTVGAVQGFAAGSSGVPMPAPSTQTQQRAQELGKAAGELWGALKSWFESTPED